MTSLKWDRDILLNKNILQKSHRENIGPRKESDLEGTESELKKPKAKTGRPKELSIPTPQF